jgi:hypothetical protein
MHKGPATICRALVVAIAIHCISAAFTSRDHDLSRRSRHAQKPKRRRLVQFIHSLANYWKMGGKTPAVR